MLLHNTSTQLDYYRLDSSVSQVPMLLPTAPFAILKPQNPTMTVFEPNKARQSTDSKALKFWKGSIGLPREHGQSLIGLTSTNFM